MAVTASASDPATVVAAKVSPYGSSCADEVDEVSGPDVS